MILTSENYFSPEAMQEYMSYSQFKAFESCELKALAELQGLHKTEKEVYKEGHYFEACICGNEELFLAQNPDMISSQGKTKGELKSNYQKIQGAVDAFKNQALFSEIFAKAERQKIFTGIIAGVKFKCCIDFFVPSVGGYDTKAVKDFKKVYSEIDARYVQWYFAYGYHYQAAIYQELSKVPQHILAVSKENIPDVAALEFSGEILNNALEIIQEYAPRYDAIKQGLIAPEPCNECDYCRGIKQLHAFETISEYE